MGGRRIEYAWISPGNLGAPKGSEIKGEVTSNVKCLPVSNTSHAAQLDSLKAATVAQLHDYRIQFILVDVVLATPEVRLSQNHIHREDDGARLLSLLKHVCRHALAVQMSAYSRQELAEHGYQIEAEHFLHKPFSPATLRSLVKTLLPDLKIPTRPILPATEVRWCG